VKAPSINSAVDTMSVRCVVEAGSTGAGHRRPAPGPAPAGRALGVYSLRQMVEEAVAEAEAHAIRRALVSAKGNKSLAARILRTNYATLHAKMKRFRIVAQEFRPS
jgi:DNA-binding NtrC family response regulator